MTTPTDCYIWIKGIIDSCYTTFHFESVGKLIELFHERFPDEYDMWVSLDDARIEKYNQVHCVTV